jgi:hypothetical protein
MITKQERGASIAAVDDTHLPVLISTFRGHIELDMAQWHHVATSVILRHRYSLGQPVVYITDSRGMHVPSATVRKYWADIMRENEAMMNAMLGNLVVLDSPIMRGALTAIEWLTTLTRRIHYVATMEQAEIEANRCLRERGYPPVALDGKAYRVE